MVNVKPVQLGKNVRMSFSHINEVLSMPNLIEVQKKSYGWFLTDGLKEVFKDVSSITDFTGNLVLSFVDFTIEDKAKYSVEECKERDATYAAPLHVLARLVNRETGEVKDQEIFMGDFPLMTDSGTFIINGAERVIVSQLVRSPGVYFGMQHDKTGKKLFSATVIPNRGAWLEYETDVNDVFYVRFSGLDTYSITIFNRWGEKVYVSDTPSEGWDGNYKGEALSAGVYFYIIDARGMDKKVIRESGTISLFR